MKLIFYFLVSITAFASNDAKTTEPEKRSEIQMQLKSQLDSINHDIDSLKAKLSSASQQTKKDLQSQVDNLDRDRKKVRDDLSRLSHSTGRAWDQVKTGVEEAMSQLSLSFKKAKQEFQGEPAK